MLINSIPDLPVDEPVQVDLEEHGEEGRPAEDTNEVTQSKARWQEHFPHQAGHRLRREPTMFESLHNAQINSGESIWGMFLDEGDWEVAQWIVKTGTTQADANEFLKLKKVSKQIIVKRRTYYTDADSRRQLYLIPQ
jgi:hypothetical protein